MHYLIELSESPFFLWLKGSSSVWAYPTVLTLHTIGLALLVGFSAAINLRLLGVGSALPLPPMEKLFRLIWVGFWINAVSGTLLLLADPHRLLSGLFLTKMTLIFAGVFLIMITYRVAFRKNDIQFEPTGSTKTLATASLVIWVGAIVAGRLMAYLGTH